MSRIKFFLERWGLHAFLLPVFFVIHSYQQYYGLVRLYVAIKLALIILLCIAFLFLVIRTLLKHQNKSLQLVTLFSFIMLFFGIIKDFLQFSLHSYFISKYSVLLPLVGLIAIFLSWLVIKKKDFRKSNLFQNTLLLLFIIIDIAKVFVIGQSSFLNKNLLTEKPPPLVTNSTSVTARPDVYFLVFDSYPGTSFLKKFMNFDNGSFNQELEELGFFVVKNPKSNYNRTAFSIASTLNFGYLQNIYSYKNIGPKDYAQANLTIKESIIPKFFKQQNYSFYNLSIFDIGTTEAIRRETFLTMPEPDILLYNTLPGRIKHDLLWNLLAGKYSSRLIQNLLTKSKEEFKREQEEKNSYNNIVLDSLARIPFQEIHSSKFVYAHLYLPHPPFFYDENGKRNDINYIVTDSSLRNKDLFLSYLKYTNKLIIEIVKKINGASQNKSVIIVQSDHGFRDFAGGPSHPQSFFKNYSAIYFPDKNYSTLYDTLSNVNVFPIILNKYFNTSLSMKQDSSVFLPY